MNQTDLELWNQLSELTEIQRRDYRAVCLEGFSVRDQAARRGVTGPTVQVNVNRAREILEDGGDPGV